jgi:hypothetical protein
LRAAIARGVRRDTVIALETIAARDASDLVRIEAREKSVRERRPHPDLLARKIFRGDFTYRGDVEMKLNWKNTIGGLALLAMALPVWARTDSVQFVTTQPTTIDGFSLAPGSYNLKADDSTNQVTVEQNGTVVTQIPCKWVQLPQKPDHSEVISNASKVTQLEFSGKTEAATFNR